MAEVYTVIYQTGIVIEDVEKWDERPKVGKTWVKFNIHFADAQQKMRQR